MPRLSVLNYFGRWIKSRGSHVRAADGFDLLDGVEAGFVEQFVEIDCVFAVAGVSMES